MTATKSPLQVMWHQISGNKRTVESYPSLISDVNRYAEWLDPADRYSWLEFLHSLYRQHRWNLSTDHLLQLFDIGDRWSDRAFVCYVGKVLLQKNSLDIDRTLLLLDSLKHMGEMEYAINLSIACQLAKPRNLVFVSIYRSLLAWNDSRCQLGLDAKGILGDDDLQLEPMGHHHIRDFAWQYYDPAIAERCCLPKFRSDNEWHEWLDDTYRYGDQGIYAVIHREWGFIGNVSLIQHAGIGFFSYWLGRDFQGKGFGPRAVALMLSFASERYGLHTCYAKVFDVNIPSRRALEKLGFEDIQVSAVSPDDNEMFYRRGPSADRDLIAEELHWLMAAMNASTRPAILVRTKG